jgi:acyl-CoA dehydrogenase
VTGHFGGFFEKITSRGEDKEVGSFNFQLPKGLEDFRLKVRDFITQEILPLERTLEPDAVGLSDEDLIQLQQKAKAKGLWALGVPKKFGGQERSIFELTLSAEESSQHRLGAYNPALGAFGSEPPNVMYEGTERQIQKYVIPAIEGRVKKTFIAITEPSGGSDPARAIRTKAVLDGDHWVLNGSKIFITGVDKSEYGVVFARSDPGREGITSFIVEKGMPGFSWKEVPVIRPWYPYELSFDNCLVSRDHQLGERGQGFRLLNKWLIRNRIPYTAGCIGIALAATRYALSYAQKHEATGVPRVKNQSIQWVLDDSEVEIRAARWLVWEAAWKADRKEDARRETSIAKVFGTETANRVIDRCIQICGLEALADHEMPLGRWYRELRIKRIGEGPSEVHRMVIGRDYMPKEDQGKEGSR